MTALALVAAIASGLQLDTSLTVTETIQVCKWVPSYKRLNWCYTWGYEMCFSD